MLFQMTWLVVLCAMTITLWMAFYLFARGFPSRLTLRAVVVLLSLAVFYYGAYNNLFHQVPGSAALRAILLVIALIVWFSLTYQLMPDQSRKRFRWLAIGMYALAVFTIILLLMPGVFINEEGNALYVAHMRGGISYFTYSAYQFLIAFCILFTLLIDRRVGFTSQGRYFLLASLFPAISVIYGTMGLISPYPLPRMGPDLLIFIGVILLGVSVARHQTLIERRTTFQDFPVTFFTALGLSGLYILLALQLGLPIEMLAGVAGLAILTHSLYDLVREFLERLRARNESAFRKQLHALENDTDTFVLQNRFQAGLDLLCEKINASSGFVALLRGDVFTVLASRMPMHNGREYSLEELACEDVCRSGRIPGIEWIAPAFEGNKQIAVLAIGKSRMRLEYSTADLELLAEVADQIGTIVSLSNLRPSSIDQVERMVAESHAYANKLDFMAGEMKTTIATEYDAEFIKIVEEGLRHLPDYIVLGQSRLADQLEIAGDSHVERGKQLNQILVNAIESLRPEGARPNEPLPRIWYNYAVLHDAYVESVQNREIMARMYISEGTFNRTRRNALRGLARLLIEKEHAGTNSAISTGTR